MAGTTVLRQTLKLGAGCGNSACPDLSGGRGVTLVPTGIVNKNNNTINYPSAELWILSKYFV